MLFRSECGHKISKKAAMCPQCGSPAKKKTSTFTKLVAFIFAVGAIGAILNAPNNMPSTSTVAKSKPSVRVTEKQWYEGGTLHEATAGQWHASTAENQLATAADFVANVTPVKNMNELLLRATALTACISAATDDPTLYKQDVGTIGVFCVAQLDFPLK